MKEQRMKLMEEYIGDREMVTIPELADHFGVSINTIRRDLDSLQEEGKIEKIYGGARSRSGVTNSTGPLVAFSERSAQNPLLKLAIAEKAAEYIEEEDTIFIDTGTSAIPLLKYLGHLAHITIITNSIFVLHAALDYPNFTVIGLPGIVKNKTASLVGDSCLKMLDTYNISKAFIACAAYSLESGATNSSLEELPVKQKVMEKCSTRFLLVDSSKFDKAALVSFAKADDFQAVITDRTPSEKYIRFFRDHNMDLILAGDPAAS